MSRLSSTYPTILSNLKERIRQARLQAAVSANNLLLNIYWEIGYTINRQETAEGWGAKTVETLAKDLRLEFPDMKGLSPRNLRYMRDFANAYPQFEILQQGVAKLETVENELTIILQRTVAKLPWGHNCAILDKLKAPEERLFYANKALENSWSRDVLNIQIHNKLIERQGNAVTNFENTLPKLQSDLAKETLKNPYVFDFLSLGEEMQERDLEKALIQHLKKFMLELGRGFAYVGNQYNLNVNNDDFFLDLLFYNYHLHCFVVFELKVGAFKPEFAGKLNFYVNAIDDQIKGMRDQPTIGVLLCKTPNETVVKFALKGIDNPIGVADYELSSALPKQLKGEMPTIEELERELEEEAEKLQTTVDKKLKNFKDLVSALKHESIQQERTKDIVIKLFNTELKKVIDKSNFLLSDVIPEFKEGWIAPSINGSANQGLVSVDLEKQLLNTQLYSIGVNVYLQAFIKAGTKAFGISDSVDFYLERFKYVIGRTRTEVWLEKLYHEELTDEEVDSICERLVESILERINEQLLEI